MNFFSMNYGVSMKYDFGEKITFAVVCWQTLGTQRKSDNGGKKVKKVGRGKCEIDEDGQKWDDPGVFESEIRFKNRAIVSSIFFSFFILLSHLAPLQFEVCM